MRLDTVGEECEFALMEREWDDVLAASRQDSPFLGHAWLLEWWRAFGSDARLAIVTCREDESEELLGVLPMYALRVGILLPARTLRLLGDEQVGATGLGAFARSEIEDQVVAALAGYVRSADRGWDVLDLRLVDPNGSFFANMSRPKPGGRRVRVERDAYARPRAGLPDSYESYLRNCLHRQERKNVRRALRKATEAGARMDLITERERIPEAVADLVRLVEGRMQQVVGPGFRLSLSVVAFMLLAFPALLDEGRLRLLFLVIGDERVAVDYNVRHGTTTYMLLSGFDERWGSADVSKALAGYSIEQAIADGSTVIDLGLGDQQHKFAWGISEVPRFCDIRAYAASAAALLRCLEMSATRWVADALLASPAAVRKPLLRLGRSAHKALERMGRRSG